LEPAQRRAKLKEIYDLAQGASEFEGGVTFQDDVEALLVGDWAIFAIDEIGDLALSFHLDSHPVAVAKLARFLVLHDVPFVLHEAFTIDDEDQIVFESDTGSGLADGA
jgi:hypothetical protein